MAQVEDRIVVDGVTLERMVIPFGSVRVGDYVNTPHGLRPVVEVKDEHIPIEMFVLENEDGQSIEVSGDHLVYVETSLDKKMRRSHVKRLKNFVKHLSVEQKEFLEDAVWSKRDATVTQIVDGLNLSSDEEYYTVLRVCCAIGPSRLDDEPYGYTSERYSLARFASQLFAAVDDPEKVIIGRVMTVSAINEFYDGNMFLPDVKLVD